jgi:hypothetical protein
MIQIVLFELDLVTKLICGALERAFLGVKDSLFRF